MESLVIGVLSVAFLAALFVAMDLGLRGLRP